MFSLSLSALSVSLSLAHRHSLTRCQLITSSVHGNQFPHSAAWRSAGTREARTGRGGAPPHRPAQDMGFKLLCGLGRRPAVQAVRHSSKPETLL